MSARAPAPDDGAACFAALRPHLTRVAYRMLGSAAEAEDVVQDAYLRWHRTERAAVGDARAFLTRTVTRLCLDVFKSARMQRETYIGPWLPEPVFDAPGFDTPASNAPGFDTSNFDTPEAGESARLRDDDITFTLMLALERLSPLERAAFLLHDIFGMSFAEVAQSVQRDAAACRQLATRARKHVREARARFPLTAARGQDIAAAFFEASRSGDTVGLRAVLADDVVAYTDGGGKIAAAHKPIYGRDKVVRMFVGLARKDGYQPLPLLARGNIDGLPGFLTGDQAGVLQTTALEIDETGVRAIYITRNPDKLKWMANFERSRAHGAG